MLNILDCARKKIPIGAVTTMCFETNLATLIRAWYSLAKNIKCHKLVTLFYFKAINTFFREMKYTVYTRNLLKSRSVGNLLMFIGKVYIFK